MVEGDKRCGKNLNKVRKVRGQGGGAGTVLNGSTDGLHQRGDI